MTAKDEVPMLIAQTGPVAGQRWALNKTELVLGRDADCDIVIPDRQVSRQHARLRRVENAFWLEDLASKNGTHLNGVPVETPRRLQDGDLVQVALVARLAYVGSDSTVPLGGELPGLPMPLSPPTGGRVRLESAARRVWVGDQEVDPPLSVPQFRFVELLYQHAGQVCARDTVIKTVWPEVESAGVSEQALDALVRRVRDRFAEADPSHPYILTVRGHGFRLDVG